MRAAICPADKAHGEMVELFNSGVYYCYECKWVKESRRILEDFMTIKQWLKKSRIQLIVNTSVPSFCTQGHCRTCKVCCFCAETDRIRDEAFRTLMNQGGSL